MTLEELAASPRLHALIDVVRDAARAAVPERGGVRDG